MVKFIPRQLGIKNGYYASIGSRGRKNNHIFIIKKTFYKIYIRSVYLFCVKNISLSMICARGSLLSDVASFHQKTRRWLSITYPGAALLLSEITLPKLFLK